MSGKVRSQGSKTEAAVKEVICSAGVMAETEAKQENMEVKQ